jgi:hypothetical protein
VIVGLFEVIVEINGVAMAVKLWAFLNKFFLTKKEIAYVKYKGSNLKCCAIVLNSIVSCKSLGMLEPFHGFYFGHVLPRSTSMPLQKKKFVMD